MMKTHEVTNYFQDTLKNEAVILQPGEGETLALGAGRCTFKVTSDMSNDQLGIYEFILAPHTPGAKLHYHRYMDETFIVIQGTLTIQLADKTVEAVAGSVVYVPRLTPHGFSNESDAEVKLMLVFNPGQKREGYFHGLFELLKQETMDMQALNELYTKYDSPPVSMNG